MLDFRYSTIPPPCSSFSILIHLKKKTISIILQSYSSDFCFLAKSRILQIGPFLQLVSQAQQSFFGTVLSLYLFLPCSQQIPLFSIHFYILQSLAHSQQNTESSKLSFSFKLYLIHKSTDHLLHNPVLKPILVPQASM